MEAQEALDATGDLLMVLWIGRKGTKTALKFYNLTIEQALGMVVFYMTAWSFESNSPTTERALVHITLREDQLVRLGPVSDLRAAQRRKVTRMAMTKSVKHLGIISSLEADMYKFEQSQVHLAKARLATLRLQRILRIPG